jgi:ankyrin repeat protein
MQQSPLHYAARGYSMDAVRFLVREGCNVLAVDDSGQTAVDAIKVSNLNNLLP